MRKRMKKSVYLSLGLLFIALALLGVFLPLLPTTPFVLVAAFFFSKASERWHRWLVQNRLFGPIISNWERYRCMPSTAKSMAFFMMALFGGVSILTLPELWLKVLTLMLIGYGVYFINTIRSCTAERVVESKQDEQSL